MSRASSLTAISMPFVEVDLKRCDSVCDWAFKPYKALPKVRCQFQCFHPFSFSPLYGKYPSFTLPGENSWSHARVQLLRMPGIAPLIGTIPDQYQCLIVYLNSIDFLIHTCTTKMDCKFCGCILCVTFYILKAVYHFKKIISYNLICFKLKQLWWHIESKICHLNLKVEQPKENLIIGKQYWVHV